MTKLQATFAFCPSSCASEGTGHRKLVTQYLANNGYLPRIDKRSREPAPNLLVIAPPVDSGLRLQVDDLLVFQRLFCGPVLYCVPVDSNGPEDAVSAINAAHGNLRVFSLETDNSDLSKWMGRKRKTRTRRRSDTAPKAVSLLTQSLGFQKSKQLLTAAADLFRIPFAKDIGQPNWCDVLYVLRHVAESFSSLEHDLNRDAQQLFAQPEKNLSQLYRKRDLLNAAHDFWSALKAAHALQEARSDGNDRQCILLVDDNPENLKAPIVDLVRCLMPCHEVWGWNPNREEKGKEAKAAFEYLRSYSSLIGPYKSREGEETATERHLLDKTENGMAEAWYPNGARTEHLDEILKRSSFVLVDLLFRIGGKEDEHGAALIRGLRRFVVDHPLKDNNGPLPPPRFIAFSRSDDLEKIQRALRAGASGYVLKNRLLSLPAELARLRVGTGRDRCLLHRNFHALDALPNETKGLLHEVRIPPIRFDRKRYTNRYATELEPKSRAHRMARLLRAIPKADLHLHVGSCMTPEFLVIASILMLAEGSSRSAPVQRAITHLFGFWLGRTSLTLAEGLGKSPLTYDHRRTRTVEGNESDPVEIFGAHIRHILRKAIIRDARSRGESEKGFSLRSLLHDKLNIRDHWTANRACEELAAKDSVSLMLFAITTGTIGGKEGPWSCSTEITRDDVLRLFILFWATHYAGDNVRIRVANQDFYVPLRRLKDIIGSGRPDRSNSLKQLGVCLDAVGKSVDLADLNLPDRLPLDVSLGISRDQMLRPCPDLRESPLEFLIATGTRGRTLAEYLAGCEYAGAEHLRRPGLMGLYARQTLEYLVRHGVLYAELRSAVSGYASKGGLSYQQACTFFQQAFGEEQKRLMEAYRASHATPAGQEEWQEWTWCTAGESADIWPRVFKNSRSFKPLDRLFPAKVNLIFTGKRHKATREMLMEAAAGVMLNSESTSDPIPASEFTAKNMSRCRVVGFDLAGLEESFPPEMFRPQFEQLSRMHIPITAHAGENASASFVESAVLDLRARRLGHGLALADDEKLMARVREERICIELCPVSNYQTNEFADSKPGRVYPLQKFLKFGNIVCLNTDNPIVSYTNIVKEFFQASYAYACADGDAKGDLWTGLSLWDALRMIRMGFAHAFKGLAERRALIELVEQMIFDLLIHPDVEKLLRQQAQEAAAERRDT